MYDVFISYRRTTVEGHFDAARVVAVDPKARLVYNELKHRGVRVFFDKECLPGGDFGMALHGYIHNCKVCLAVMSDLARGVRSPTHTNCWRCGGR